MVEVEIVAPQSTESLLDLMERFYAEERYPFDRDEARAALEPFLGDPTLGRAWLFRDGGAAVGYFVFTLGWSLEYGGRDAFVDELFVSLSHRGRGLGRRALEVIEEACRELRSSSPPPRSRKRQLAGGGALSAEGLRGPRSPPDDEEVHRGIN